MYGRAQSTGKAVRIVAGQRAHACPIRSPANPNAVAGISSSTSTVMAAGVAFCMVTILIRQRILQSGQTGEGFDLPFEGLEFARAPTEIFIITLDPAVGE